RKCVHTRPDLRKHVPATVGTDVPAHCAQDPPHTVDNVLRPARIPTRWASEPPTGPDAHQAGLRPVGPQISWDVLTRVMITTTASTTAQVPYWISVRF